jgi:hypothetical protein
LGGAKWLVHQPWISPIGVWPLLVCSCLIIIYLSRIWEENFQFDSTKYHAQGFSKYFGFFLY